MDIFLGFVCLTCNTIDTERVKNPLDTYALQSSACPKCGSIISQNSKHNQIKDYEYSGIEYTFRE